MRALLDVNVLIALLDGNHAHHGIAIKWLSDHIVSGWASCAITQNGCARILSQQRYAGSLPLPQVLLKLRQATMTPHHQFLDQSLSVLELDRFDHSRLINPKQITDAWLLALAVENECRLVTFDQGITLAAVRNASDSHLLVL